MFDVLSSRLELTGRLELVTAMRIGAGRSLEPDEPDLPVIKDALGRPYLPGSSFKGVLRSYAESLLRAATLEPEKARQLACNPLSDAHSRYPNKQTGKNEEGPGFRRCLAQDELTELKKEYLNRLKPDPAGFDRALLEKTCLTCQLFGAQWLASAVQIRDLLITKDFLYENRYSYYEVRNGVAINRDTETASDGMLYDFEVIPGGVIFEFKALVENASPALLGLLFLALRVFEQERKGLGGATSRGLGGVKLSWQGHYFDIAEAGETPQSRLSNLFAYLEDPLQSSKAILPGDATVREWVAALRTEIGRLIEA